MQRFPSSPHEIKNHCSKEDINGQNLASILKFGPEIKNRCTLEGLNGEKLASIPKFGLEIKNRCTKQPILQHAFHHALTTRLALDVCMGTGSTVVRQWRRKRVLMRPEAAFPYVFAAEGAQHPPKKPPRSTTSRHETSHRRPATNPRSQQKSPAEKYQPDY